MYRAFLILLFAVSAFGVEPSHPFDSPVTGFAGAFTPILSSFEQASVTTTLRGFFARGDSFPGYERSKSDLSDPANAPSEYGLYLSVAVNEDVKEFSDHTEQKDGLTHRSVEIPAPERGQQSLVVELWYGPQVSPKVIQAIDTSITSISKPTRK